MERRTHGACPCCRSEDTRLSTRASVVWVMFRKIGTVIPGSAEDVSRLPMAPGWSVCHAPGAMGKHDTQPCLPHVDRGGYDMERRTHGACPCCRSEDTRLSTRASVVWVMFRKIGTVILLAVQRTYHACPWHPVGLCVMRRVPWASMIPNMSTARRSRWL